MALFRKRGDGAALLGQLDPWERGCFDRAQEHWLSLLSAVQGRDTGRKLVALDALLAQLRAWRDLLEKGGSDLEAFAREEGLELFERRKEGNNG